MIEKSIELDSVIIGKGTHSRHALSQLLLKHMIATTDLW